MAQILYRRHLFIELRCLVSGPYDTIRELTIQIAFRTDASLLMGSGHVMRCLTLAEALRKKGVQCHFISRVHPGNLLELIRQRGFAATALPSEQAKPLAHDQVVGNLSENPLHGSWLGCDWRTDAEQTRTILAKMKPDWLVVDHYALDHRWESFQRASVGRIMVVDDLADRVHDCDLLLDQNLVAQTHSRYAGKVPAACSVLLGSRYTLLQPIYAELHDRTPPREGPIRRILIFFGGVDSDNLTGRSLSAFLSLKRQDILVDVVITASFPHAEAIEQQIKGHANIRLHIGLPTLAQLIAKADLALGASGATSWERLCLGLPALVVTLAQNQRSIADELGQRGLIRWLGHTDSVDHMVIADALGKLVHQGLNEDWSLRCLEAVDGKGVYRVCAILTLTATTSLQVRHARLEDEEISLEWASVPTTSGHSYSAKSLNPEIHRDWFRKCLRDLDSTRLFYVQTEESVPVGQVRFHCVDKAWRIDYSLAPHFRRRGLDHVILESALIKLREEEPGALVLLQAMESNQLSSCVLESLDFGANLKKAHASNIGICSDTISWINTSIPKLILKFLGNGHQVSWAHDPAALPAGDICFYLSYSRIVGAEILRRYRNNLVVHESNLPKGRGWSPLTWQVLEGADSIWVTLFEAAEAVDSGTIYLQEKLELRGDELVQDLRHLQVQATFLLCHSFAANYPHMLKNPLPNSGEPSYYRRRTPADGELDPDQTLRAQFNLLRVSDNKKYPAWFQMSGKKYNLYIERAVTPVEKNND